MVKRKLENLWWGARAGQTNCWVAELVRGRDGKKTEANSSVADLVCVDPIAL